MGVFCRIFITLSIILFLYPIGTYALDYDCVLVKDGGTLLKQQLSHGPYGVLTQNDVSLAIDHLFDACCRGDQGGQLANLCTQHTSPIGPKSMYLFDQLIAIGFEKLTSLRGDEPLFEGLSWPNYDPLANQRYQYLHQEALKYEGTLPEVIAEKFRSMRKVDILAPNHISTPCTYNLPIDIGLVGRHYHVCDIAYCIMNQTYIRSQIKQQGLFNQSSNKDFVNCKAQANQLIVNHIKQTQAVVMMKAFAYQNNNRNSYVKELIGSDLMPKIMETADGLTSDLSMVMQVSNPRATQCFGN